MGMKHIIKRTALAVGTLWAAQASAEQVDLESTFVGDKEQPAVSFFIPWESTKGPVALYRPLKSISGNVLETVDKEVLERNVQFYEELSLEDSQNTVVSVEAAKP